LLPLGRSDALGEATAKKGNCCAVQREQAPSPQKLASPHEQVSGQVHEDNFTVLDSGHPQYLLILNRDTVSSFCL